MENWKNEKLRQCVEINVETLNSNTNLDYQFKYIDISSVSKGKIDVPTDPISYGSSPSRARRIFQKGDILFGTVRPYLQSHAYVNFDVKDMIASTGFAVLRAKNNVISKYLYHYIFSDEIQRQIDSLLVGSNYPAINSTDVGNLLINLPPLPEQKKIAEILSTWDEAITKYEDLIAGAEKYRQSIISKILSKKYISMSRSDEWKEVPLGTLIEQVSEKTTINNQYPILTSSRKGIFLQEDYFKKSVASSNNIGYKIIRNGEFTFRAMSDDGTFKFNRLLEHEIGIVSPAYSVFKAVHVEPRFLDVYMNSHIFTKEIAKASQGGTRLSLKYVALAKFKITVPNKKRQVEIANLNDDIEHYIASLKGYKTQLILQKQGLMQRLLTGKVRVKLD